ncbi:hypothetical protein BH09MYX1_BH09MYX1_29650 [soil metagenome]
MWQHARMRKLLSALALGSAVAPFVVVFAGSSVACSKDNPAAYPSSSIASAPNGNGTAPATGSAGSTDVDVEAVVAQLASQRVSDMHPEMPTSKFDLMMEGHQKVGVNLQVGKCYAIIVAGPTGANIDVAVQANGTTLVSDQTQEPFVVLGAPPTVLCPPQSGELVVDVSIHNTGGRVGFALFAKQAGAVAGQPSATGSGMPTAWVTPTSTGTPTAVPTGPSTAISTEDPTELLLRSKATTLAPGMQPDGSIFKQTVNEGAKASFISTLQAGRCYTIVAVGGVGVTDVDLLLMLPPFYTSEVARDKRTDTVAVVANVCPASPIPLPYRIDVGPKKGNGMIVAQVYSKAK